MPFVFHPTGSPAGRQILEEVREPDAGVPVVVQRNGRVLVDPTNVEIAEAYGARTRLPGSREYDVTVVGAGPSGLAAAVYASSEGLRTLVIERETIGGQAGSSSLIRNYLGFQRGVTGADLATRAQQQAWVFGTTFLQMCQAQAIRSDADRLYLTTSSCAEIATGAVVLAMGVSYRRLGIPSLDELVGQGVFYGASASEAERFTGRSVFVVGAGNSAGQAAVHLAAHATQGDDPGATHDARRDDVALPHRGDRGAAQHRRPLPNRDRRRIGRRRAREPHPARLWPQARPRPCPPTRCSS